MHSFQPSRGRVLFEVVCALAISASLVGAWLQPHSSALLGAAGVTVLYALVRLFDMRRSKPALVVEPQRIEFERDAQRPAAPLAAVEEQPAIATCAEEAVTVEPEPPRANNSRATAPRKSGGRRAKAPKAAKVAEPATAEAADVHWPAASDGTNRIEVAPSAEEELAWEDMTHPHIAPLFEPEPFARMPRRAFGRKAG